MLCEKAYPDSDVKNRVFGHPRQRQILLSLADKVKHSFVDQDIEEFPLDAGDFDTISTFLDQEAEDLVFTCKDFMEACQGIVTKFRAMVEDFHDVGSYFHSLLFLCPLPFDLLMLFS